MTLFPTIFGLVFIINIIFAILLVFFERRNPASTWAWLMVLLFLPTIGFILYLFIGQNMRRRKLFSTKELEDYALHYLKQQEASLEMNNISFNNPKIHQFQDIIHMHLISGKSLYTQNNNIELYVNGKDKFRELKYSLYNAKEYIYLQYYIFRNDKLGKEILHILEEKAEKGTEVKVLYDGMGGILLPNNFFNRLKKKGGKVAVFFPPFLPYINLRVNYRNHRKICIIDGKDAFTGGFNIGDEYLGNSKRFGFWRDTHIKISGSAVNDLRIRFLLDWNFASKEKMPYEYDYVYKYNTSGNTGVQIVSSGPDSPWSLIRDGFFKMINSARKNLYIQTPYFIPDESIFEALKIASLSGVDVRIMIPQMSDHLFVHWASYSYLGELIKVGVKCYLYNNGFLHSKTITVDGIVSTVGTANMDIRSFNLNFEVNAFIYDKKISKRLEDAFIEDIEYCDEITQELYDSRSSIVRLKEAISRLISPML